MTKKKISVFLFTAALAICFQGCSKTDVQAAGDQNDDQRAMASGLSTLEAACFSCHAVDPSLTNPIAPSLAAIKQHYIDRHPDYESFQTSLVGFLGDPSRDNAIVPNAVEDYGLMPKMSFERKTLEDVAFYLYYSEIELTDWYATQYQSEKEKYTAEELSQPSTIDDYLSYGQQLAMQTKTELGSNLKRALQAGGAPGAVEFCHVRAEPIADEMSSLLGARISRVSDRPRNPNNLADATELEVLDQFRRSLAADEKPVPTVREFKEHMIGYYPIVTNGMCLQCHGSTESDIDSDTLGVIRAAYPDDQAVGYGIEQLRGMFVVRMNKAESASQTD